MKSIINQMEELSLFKNYELKKEDFWYEEIMCEEDYDKILRESLFCSNEGLCYVLDLCKKRIDEMEKINNKINKFYNEVYTFQYSLTHLSTLLNEAKTYFNQFDTESAMRVVLEYDENGNEDYFQYPNGEIEHNYVEYKFLKFCGHEAEQQTEQTCERWISIIHELNEEALRINEIIISERKEAINYFNNTKLF